MNYHDLIKEAACYDTWERFVGNEPGLLMQIVALKWQAGWSSQPFDWRPDEPFVEDALAESFWRGAALLVAQSGGSSERARAARDKLGDTFGRVLFHYFQDQIRKDFEEEQCYQSHDEMERDLMLPQRSVM